MESPKPKTPASPAPAPFAAATPPADGPAATVASPPSDTAPTEAPRPAGKAPGNVGRRVVKGSLWVIGGYGANQVLRLGSTLVLARLLFPEAFGLMAMVTVVLQAIGMLSDAGLRGSIIYDERGEDREFLNTAYTLQVVRGLAVGVVILAISVPTARFYEAPELVYLLPVMAGVAMIAGTSSTALHSLARDVSPRRPVMLELGARIASIAVMIGLALVWRSVWVLMIGAVMDATIKAVGSHWLVPGYRNRLQWNGEMARSMLAYGRWIFLSSAITFVLGQGDRLILAKLLTTDDLGIYSFAVLLSSAVLDGVNRLAGSILQPVYARLLRQPGPQLRRQTLRVRGALLAVALPPLWLLATLGPEVVDLLFDDRYADAGWMVQILSIGTIGMVIAATAERVLTASGDSFAHLVLKVITSVLFLGGMALGSFLGQLPGLLIGISAARIVGYVPLAVLLRRKGVWLPELDFAAFGTSAAVIGLGFFLRGLL